MIGALERLRTAIEIACELPEHGMFGGDMPYENDITDLTGFELVVLQRAAAQIRPIWPITVNTDLVNRTIDMNSDSIKETGAPRSLDWSAYQTVLCYPTLDRSGLEFSALLRFGGLVSPAEFASMIGGIFPIALCGRSSL